jgi:hypothetical protein
LGTTLSEYSQLAGQLPVRVHHSAGMGPRQVRFDVSRDTEWQGTRTLPLRAREGAGKRWPEVF